MLDRDLFKWYWDKLMPKAAGSAKIWPANVCYFGLLSTHSAENDPKKPYILYQTEAFAVLCILNFRERWLNIRKKKTNNKKPIRYGKVKGTEESSKFAKIDMANNEEFVTKYSRNDSGQAKYGGWTPLGIVLLVQLMETNKKACAKHRTKSI